LQSDKFTLNLRTNKMKNDNTTVNNSGLTSPDAKGTTVAEDNVIIEKGNTILGLYTIESDAIVGGMGSVYRVHHTGWKVDLAMKKKFWNEFSIFLSNLLEACITPMSKA